MIPVDVTKIRIVLFEEYEQVGVLSDRLPRTAKVRLSNVENVDVIMPTPCIVCFAFVLWTQHDVIEHQEVFLHRIVLGGVGDIFNIVNKRCIDAPFTRAVVVVDKLFRIFSSIELVLIFKEFVHLVLRETLGECTSHDFVLGLMQASTAHRERIVVQHVGVKEEIVEQRRLSKSTFADNDRANALL